MAIQSITSQDQFNRCIKDNKYVLIHFFAPWAQQCQTIKTVVDELSKIDDYKNAIFAECEAEEMPEISLQYKIQAVPTVLIFSNGQVVETINGANAKEIVDKLGKVIGKCPSVTTNENCLPLEERLKSLINQSPVMVFMKGDPQQPRCGFSKTLVAILNKTSVPYKTFDILQDEEVRQGLKTFSKWPTYPQIYVKGELIGGLDIIKELEQSGELVANLQGN